MPVTRSQQAQACPGGRGRHSPLTDLCVIVCCPGPGEAAGLGETSPLSTLTAVERAADLGGESRDPRRPVEPDSRLI